MTEHTNTSPRPSLFARKGEAEPAPAVAYVSLRQMQGKPDRREEGPDRRAQWGAGQGDGESPGSPAPQRRVFTASGSDYDGRRHFTPRSGLALGQRYVPWTAPENKADAPKDTASARKAKSSVSTLSALIHRHQDSVARPASRAPEPAPVAQREAATATPSPETGPATPRRPEARSAAGPTMIDMTFLSASGAPGWRSASPKAPAGMAAPQAAQPPATRKRKIPRRKVTVRLEIDQFLQVKAHAQRTGESHQSVMASAVADYLKKID